jgi:hypothetical protein
MQNCAQEVHQNEWFSLKYATWSHKKNAFAEQGAGLWILDYIFKKLNSPGKINAWTYNFEIPQFTTRARKYRLSNVTDKKTPWRLRCTNLHTVPEQLNSTKSPDEKKLKCKLVPYVAIKKRLPFVNDFSLRKRDMSKISLSDHEPIAATIYIQKKGIYIFNMPMYIRIRVVLKSLCDTDLHITFSHS